MSSMRERAKEPMPLYRRSMIFCMFTAVCFVFCFAMQNLTLHQAKRDLPSCIVMRSETLASGLNIDFSDNMNWKLTTDMVAGKAARVSQASGSMISTTDSRIEPVNLYYTDPYFDALANLHLIRGRYFTDIFGGSSKYVCVISEQSAIRHFQTPDAVGLNLRINGTVYTVCAVYRESNTLAAQLGGNGRESVYLPYTTAEGTLQTHFLYVSPELTRYTHAANASLSNLMGRNPYARYITGYGDLLATMQFALRTFVYLAAISLILLLYRPIQARQRWRTAISSSSTGSSSRLY